MALYKELELSNGIVMTYHRIVNLTILTNKHNFIEVQSYISKAKREEEKAIDNSDYTNIFVSTLTYEPEYDQTMTIESAYQGLKENIEEFKDATDI